MDGRWNEDTVQPFVTLLASGVPSPLERLLCWSGTGEGGRGRTIPFSAPETMTTRWRFDLSLLRCCCGLLSPGRGRRIPFPSLHIDLIFVTDRCKILTQTYIRHVIDYIYKGLISATCEAVVHFQGSFVLLSFGSEMKWEDLLNVPHPPSL